MSSLQPGVIGRFSPTATSTVESPARGPAALVQRVGILERGLARKDASEVERAALRFKAEKTPPQRSTFLLRSVGTQECGSPYRRRARPRAAGRMKDGWV